MNPAQCHVARTLNDRDRFRSLGYQFVAEVLWLEADSETFPPAPPNLSFCLESDQPVNLARWAAVLAQTQEGCLDRTVGVADFRGVPHDESRPTATQRWFVVDQRQDVGCLALETYADLGQCYLAYLGVVPRARRRGWGKQLAQFAQWATRLAGIDRLAVAVDAENRPAVLAYLATGFRPIARRALFLQLAPCDKPDAADR